MINQGQLLLDQGELPLLLQQQGKNNYIKIIFFLRSKPKSGTNSKVI